MTAYGWDQRNRLVAVSHVSGWTATQAGAVADFSATGAGVPGSDLELRYTYDFADRRIRRSLDADGVAGAGQESVSYAAYAGSDRTLEIARGGAVIRDGGGRMVGFLGGVVQRNLYGPGEDEILAVDRVAGGTTSTFWTLADRQGTVRDIVSGTVATRGQVVEHRQYDAYGKLVRRTTSAAAGAPVTAGVGIDFGYAGRPLEERTGLSDNRARWYEPGTGRFVSEDPSGFKGGDANLFRYVGNDPLDRIDPSGLMAKWAQPSARSSVPSTGWAGMGQGVTTTPAVGTSRTIVSPPAPTFSLTVPALPKAAATQPIAFSSLRTTVSDTRGMVYTPPVISTTSKTESPRWTLLDKVTKLASDKAYYVNDGGLLPQFVKDYNPSGKSGVYGGSGFSATLSRASDHAPYASEDTYVLALRGTNGLLNGSDWLTNIRQFCGFKTSQYDQAIDLARAVKNSLPPGARLIVTGHSKGGGQAVAVAYALGVEAIVHNPASVSPVYLQGTPGYIRTHITFGDPLSAARTISNLSSLEQPMSPSLRSAVGEVFVHFPLSPWTHGLRSLPY